MTKEEWSRVFEALIISLPDNLLDEHWKQIEDHLKLLKEMK
jgi:hypothetical protein